MKTRNIKRATLLLYSTACFILIASLSCTQNVRDDAQRTKENTWVFLLAGQSNMAGRGKIESQDTVKHPRVWSINADGVVIAAQEPLHFYEPRVAGLDCGMSFARTLIEEVPDNVHILLIPTAVGGSPIDKWLGDSLHRNVRLLTNFSEKMEIAKREGDVKAILWHQGEGDATPDRIPPYPEKMSRLFRTFREMAGNDSLLILAGETGSYGKNKENRDLVNAAIWKFAADDVNARVISSANLPHKGDETHFNSESLRTLGQRYATEYLRYYHKDQEAN